MLQWNCEECWDIRESVKRLSESPSLAQDKAKIQSSISNWDVNITTKYFSHGSVPVKGHWISVWVNHLHVSQILPMKEISTALRWP